MGEPDIYAVATRHRRELLAGERAAASEMVRYYGESWKRINASLKRLLQQWEDAQAAGVATADTWLNQYNRLLTMRQQVEAEMQTFSRFAEGKITAQQANAVMDAQARAEELVRASMGPGPVGVLPAYHRIPTEAFTDLVGFLRDGSPLRALLDQLPGAAGQEVADALTTGLVMGNGPRAIARDIRKRMGMGLDRALRISRTETLRAHREASRRSFEGNPELVEGWRWMSALQPGRTCAACWAMHGTWHPLSEKMSDHPNGRCQMLPATKTWAELGFKDIPETRKPMEDGKDAFAKLTPAQQDATLGAAGGAAYRDGKVELRDFLATRRSKAWGVTKSARGLAGAMEVAKKREAP